MKPNKNENFLTTATVIGCACVCACACGAAFANGAIAQHAADKKADTVNIAGKVNITGSSVAAKTKASQPTFSLSSLSALPSQVAMMQERPWSVLGCFGSTDARNLGELIKGQYVGAGESLYSGEVAYTLKQTNPIIKFLYPWVSAVQLAGDYAYRVQHAGNPNVHEGDAYLLFRWAHFPWDQYVAMTAAAGEGISYVSRVPILEIDGVSSDGSKRLLNFLAFEVTFALPKHPELQLVVRIHHRSGAYGVFSNGNAGSNNLGLGLRYYF